MKSTTIQQTTFLLLCFLLSYTVATSQHLAWANNLDGKSSHAVSVKTDGLGNVYTGGYYSGNTDFDPSENKFECTKNVWQNAFIQKLDSEGNFVWAKTFGGEKQDAISDLAVDESGNVYCIGSFLNTVDFDPNEGLSNLTSSGSKDVFIQKLDKDGKLIWAKNIGGTGEDLGKSIAVDQLGNVYISGSFEEEADFDPSEAVLKLKSNGKTDVYVQKLDQDGNLLWVKTLGGVQEDVCEQIEVDKEGNVHLLGLYRGNVDFAPGDSVRMMRAVGYEDGFILKLTTEGEYTWLGGLGSARKVAKMGALAIDEWGNVYTSIAIPSYSKNYDLAKYSYLRKFNKNGRIQWTKVLRGDGQATVLAMDADAEGSIYLTGSFCAKIDFDPSDEGVQELEATAKGYGRSLFINKLDSNGGFQYASAVEGIESSEGNSLNVTAPNTFYVTGTFEQIADFGMGETPYHLLSKGKESVFVLKMDQAKKELQAPLGNSKIILPPTEASETSFKLLHDFEYDRFVEAVYFGNPKNYADHHLVLMNRNRIEPVEIADHGPGTTIEKEEEPAPVLPKFTFQLGKNEPLAELSKEEEIILLDSDGLYTTESKGEFTKIIRRYSLKGKLLKSVESKVAYKYHYVSGRGVPQINYLIHRLYPNDKTKGFEAIVYDKKLNEVIRHTYVGFEDAEFGVQGKDKLIVLEPNSKDKKAFIKGYDLSTKKLFLNKTIDYTKENIKPHRTNLVLTKEQIAVVLGFYDRNSRLLGFDYSGKELWKPKKLEGSIMALPKWKWIQKNMFFVEGIGTSAYEITSGKLIQLHHQIEASRNFGPTASGDYLYTNNSFFGDYSDYDSDSKFKLFVTDGKEWKTMVLPYELDDPNIEIVNLKGNEIAIIIGKHLMVYDLSFDKASD